jgi:hypothetical protein
MTIKKQKQNKKESKGRGKSKGNDLVASPFGLCSCLRQSGSCFAAVFDAGLKSSSILEAEAEAEAETEAKAKAKTKTKAKAKAKAKVDPPPAAKDDN